MKKEDLIKGALFGAIANAIINGIINWFTVRNHGEIPLTQDLISSGAETVFAGVVVLATSLAFILSTISYFTLKLPNKPKYFPSIFLLALRNTFFVFGVTVAVAIMIQRIGGEIMVTPLVSAIIAGVAAGIVGGFVDYLTKVDVLRKVNG